MSLFDTGKMCTFSHISGVIVKDGIPVANALVVRETNREKTTQDQTYTDENGYFEMPVLVVCRMAINVDPH